MKEQLERERAGEKGSGPSAGVRVGLLSGNKIDYLADDELTVWVALFLSKWSTS